MDTVFTLMAGPSSSGAKFGLSVSSCSSGTWSVGWGLSRLLEGTLVPVAGTLVPVAGTLVPVAGPLFPVANSGATFLRPPLRANLFSFLLLWVTSDRLSSSSTSLSSSSCSCPRPFTFCLLLFPVGTILVPVGILSLEPVADTVFGVDPVNLDLTLLRGAVVGISVSPSASPRPFSLPLSPETSSLGRTLRRPAVPVVSGSSAGLAGVRLMMPEMETGSTEGAVKGSGRRGPVGRRELGKVDCSTGSLGVAGLANCAASQGVGA